MNETLDNSPVNVKLKLLFHKVLQNRVWSTFLIYLKRVLHLYDGLISFLKSSAFPLEMTHLIF